ncbi:MAG: hypothetical protein K8F30_05705 [Taibaiella sp.]|nr:hypothetical protein [Taibaiella sp.]
MVPITPKIILELKTQQLRTGVSLQTLLKKQGNIPLGLGLAEAMSWFDAFGPVKMAEKAHIDFILGCWAHEPNVQKKGQGGKRRKISKTYIAALEFEQKRTGVKIPQLLKQSEGVPFGLTVFIVREWLKGNVKQAFPEYLDFVLNAYKALPDKKPSTKVRRTLPLPSGDKPIKQLLRSTLSPISTQTLARMRHYRDTTGILPGFIFKNASDIPKGLKSTAVAGWLNGNIKSAEPAHVEWVLNRCQEVLKAALEDVL